MATLNEDAQRIGREVHTIKTILYTELKKTMIGRLLARIFLKVRDSV